MLGKQVKFLFVYVDDYAVRCEVFHGDDDAFGAVYDEVSALVVWVFSCGDEFFFGELAEEAEF